MRLFSMSFSRTSAFKPSKESDQKVLTSIAHKTPKFKESIKQRSISTEPQKSRSIATEFPTKSIKNVTHKSNDPPKIKCHQQKSLQTL